jgi:hypothetical protein
MKKYNFLILIIISIFLTSCETNDPLRDLGTLGKQVANIYFVPIQPIADANADLEYEIEYWTVGNEIKNQSLWDKIYLTEEYDIEINNAAYIYKNTIDSLYRDKTLYKEYDFDFTDWNPAKNAYDFKSKYFVDAKYAKKTLKQNNTSKTDFFASISQNALNDIFTALIKNKSVLKKIIVENNNAVDETTFDSWYDINGKMTDDGINAAKNALLSIGPDNLIGDKYQKIESYKIYLSFKITNGFDEENESSPRGFKVK